VKLEVWVWGMGLDAKYYHLNRKEQGWGLMKTDVRLQSEFRWMFSGVHARGPGAGFDNAMMWEWVRNWEIMF